MRKFKPDPRAKRRVLLLLGVYYTAHRDGIARYAHEAGWVLNNQYAQGGLAPVWWRADGVITLITHPRDYAALQRFPRRPLVDLSKGWVSSVMTPRQRRAGRDRPRVLEDNAAIGRLAAQHFIERGFRHIALVNIGNWWMETERIPTFRATVEAAGGHYHEIAYHRHFIPGRTKRAAAEQAAHRWLTRAIRDLPKPVGIFAATDGLATQILDACDDAGVAVPEEAAVLGCDNESAMCQHAPVPLSSVDNDLEQQGYIAAQLLDRLLDGKPSPRDPILIPPKGIVTRQSTNILAVPHAQVARALRFIWEHHAEPIRTPDIAAAAGLSRRGLERMFQKHLHRSVADEVTHCRIERAKKLLLETTKKAYEVAKESGFSSDMHFSRVFLRVTGLRPGRFRRTHAADS
jgi:LacI family transcriptional regulator